MASTNSSTGPPTESPPTTSTTHLPPSSSANSSPTIASSPPPDTSSSVPPTTISTTTAPPTTSVPTTHSVPPTTTTTQPPTTTSTTLITSTAPGSTTIITTSSVNPTSTVVETITTQISATLPAGVSTTSTSTTTSSAAINPGNGSGGSGLSDSGKIAVAVVVPIAAVALLVLAGIYLWRKRKQRKEAEEQRRKEVEDYGYNPNADPTIPAVAGVVGGAGAYEMNEDASGYRGWGSTTLAGSTGRKASTTMSGGATGPAYSDATSPTRGGVSDTRSGEGMMMHDGTHSPEGEILGAMGPSAASNQSNVHRGPSNASSSYSAAGRSDGSGEGPIGVAYGGGPGQYHDQVGSNNPYAAEAPYNNQPRPSELAGQPVIRDNPARRNTRIESLSHYPQQSAGISQNF